jgi:hypothetical protein
MPTKKTSTLSSQAKRGHSKERPKYQSRIPRTAEQYQARSKRFRKAYERTIQVISKMKKDNMTLTQAAQDVGVSRDTVIRWAGVALKKNPTGRYTVKQHDKLLRMMKVPTEAGYQVVGIRGSRQATVVGQYWAALEKFWATGNASVLDKFRGLEIKDASGKPLTFITNLRQLKDLGRAGVIHFRTIYPDEI